MNRLRVSILLPVAMALAACSSAPVHYHTMSPPLTYDEPARPRAAFVVNVLPVGVPAPLDQSQLVVRHGESGISVLDTERWSSPFGDEIRGALSSRLAALLNSPEGTGSQAGSEPVLLVKVQVRRFDGWPGQRVQLVADWDLAFTDDPGHRHMSGSGRFDEAATGGFPEMTVAYQRVVEALASRMASDAGAMRALR